jgi:PIN domain nuclease of toxin-antitoxin system
MPSADVAVLDTHAWVWWAGGEPNLTRAGRRAIDRARLVIVPAPSLWEVAELVMRERLWLDRETRSWMEQSLAEERVELAPLSPEVAVAAADLGREGFHGDPTDRLIYATARVLDATLVSADRGMRAFERSLPARRARHIVW